MMNAGEDFDTAYEFLGEANVSSTCLLDADQEQYNSYARSEAGQTYAPFPMTAVVDREGRIRYLTTTYSASEIRDVVESLL